jgi:peptide/nickel transport system substrate-binding protein
MRTITRRRTLVTAVAALVLTVAACAPVSGPAPTASGAAAAQPKWGGTLVVGVYTDPKFLNSNYDFDGQAYYQNMNIFSKIVNYDYKTGTIHPDLATKWEVSPDGLKYTFTLREGVKWHDGKPFTSADVKWTYDDLIKEGAKAQAFRIITTLKSVDAPDAKTVVFNLSETDALFLVGLAGYYGANVLPKHLYEGTDVRKNPYNTKPVGTGPFKVVELVTGSHLTLEANPDYYGLGPYLDKLIFKVVPNLATMMSTLETGEVGYSAPSPPFGDVARIRTLPNMKVDQAESQIVQWTAFNLDIPKFKDLRVRQAIIHAIDKQAISTQVFAGLVTPSTATYISTVPKFYNANAKQPEFDIAKAEKLLDEAGFPRGADGIRFKTRYAAFISSLAGGPEMGQVIKQQLAKVGIDVTLEVQEFALFNEKIINKRDFEMTASGGPHGPDPSEFANFVGTGGTRNVMKYSNARIDELFRMGRKTLNEEERKKIYFEIQEIVAKELPRMNLVEYTYMRPYRSEFHDFWWQDVATQKKIGQDMYNLTWTDNGSDTHPRKK